MFSRLKALFSKNKPSFKNYSYSNDPATVGTNSRKDLDPEIKAIVDKLDRQSNKENAINNEELNKLAAFYFNTPTIEPGLFAFNTAIADNMVFNLVRIDTVHDQNGDVSNIILTMTEMVYGIEFTTILPITSFHEVFRPLKTPFLTQDA